jgi:hypothetical protein
MGFTPITSAQHMYTYALLWQALKVKATWPKYYSILGGHNF